MMKKYLSSLLLLCFSSTLLTTNSYSYTSKTERLLAPHSENFVGLTAYDQNYLMQTFSNGNFYDQQDMKHDEVKFQISLALPIWRHILGQNSVLAGSYTQKSWFQLSNTEHSSPFRETNYEPQLFLAWATDYQLPLGWRLREIETGFNHQSNGKSDEQLKSRSWNRLYARASATKGNWVVEIKPWWRIPEKSEDDDNPNITDYRGYFDLAVGYQFDKHQIKFTGHYNPAHNKGGLEVAYSYPITNYIRFYTQYYAGYGESLIDYNRNIQRIGIGISLNNVF